MLVKPVVPSSCCCLSRWCCFIFALSVWKWLLFVEDKDEWMDVWQDEWYLVHDSYMRVLGSWPSWALCDFPHMDELKTLSVNDFFENSRIFWKSHCFIRFTDPPYSGKTWPLVFTILNFMISFEVYPNFFQARNITHVSLSLVVNFNTLSLLLGKYYLKLII